MPIYVNLNATGNNDGSSWENAYTTLTAAINAANIGDEIWVAQGTYYPTEGNDREASFQLKNLVAIYGGFAGDETSRDERDWVANETILSGNIGATEDATDNSYSVVINVQTSRETILDGFIITEGYDQGDFDGEGAGIDNYDNGNAILTNLIIKDNFAQNGGGIYNNSSPLLENVVFINNSADNNGGGFYNNGEPELNNVRFENNSANNNGGGIFNYEDSVINLLNNIFINNIAENQGGGVYNDFFSSMTITNSLFINNISTEGGGIYNNNNLYVYNTTFYNNKSDYGGAIYTAEFPYATQINNSIFWNNAGSLDGEQIVNFEEINSSLLDTDPLFVDFGDGNLRLQANSPAINAGDNTVVTVEFDIDGNFRIINEIVDIGAYEFEPLTPDLIGSHFDVIQEPLQPGNKFDIEFKVKNQGAGNAENFVVSFYASDNYWFSPNDTKSGSYTVENLAGNNETEKITTNLTLPNSLAAGDYFLGMIVDAEDKIAETNKENNTNQGKFSDFDDVTINSGADLKGKFLDIFNQNITAGDIFRLAFNLENTGSGNSANFDIDFYLSDNDFISENDKYLGTYKTSLEGNSETGDILTAFILPEADDSFWKEADNYYVGMLIDTENEVAESNEENNSNTGQGIDFDAVEISLNSGEVNGVFASYDTELFISGEDNFLL